MVIQCRGMDRHVVFACPCLCVCLIKDGHTGNIIKARGVDRHVGGGCGATGEYGEVRLVCMFFCDTLHLHLAFGRVAQLAACPH